MVNFLEMSWQKRKPQTCLWAQSKRCEKLNTFKLNPQFRKEGGEERPGERQTAFLIFLCILIHTNTEQLSSLFPPGQDSAHYVMGGEEVGVGKGDRWGAYCWGCVWGWAWGQQRMNCRPVAKTFFFPCCCCGCLCCCLCFECG